MERVNQSRARSAQQEGASVFLPNASLTWRVAEEAPQTEAAELAAAPFRFTHQPNRFTIYPTGSSGLLPYRAGMERAFGADLSAVRVYCGASAFLSRVGARAAAWPETLAFASSTPSPPVVAHEIAHILQYRRRASTQEDGRQETGHRDAAEQEAARAAANYRAGASIRVQASTAVAPLFLTDEATPDSDQHLAEGAPEFAGQEVGTWGNTWPASLIARERLNVTLPESERSHAIVEAIARREPIVILHESGRLWLYRLEWEGLSARYSRFTNAETMFHEGTAQRGDYSVSNVQGRPEVEAFVTEDGGVLSPPGAGKLFSHTGGEFEDPLVSTFQNASAFLSGMGKGLEAANFEDLSAKLRRMAALNTMFPTPFAIGAVRGLADQMLDYVQLLNPQRWVAMEAAARHTILLLNDPDGEELATALGEEFGRNQAATVNALIEESLPIFAYEVGKLVGPTIIELLLALVGIEIGPVAMLQKSLAAMKQVPRLAALVRDVALVVPEFPEGPSMPSTFIPDEASVGHALSESLTPEGALMSRVAPPGLPNLSADEAALLAKTGNPTEFPSGLPQELAKQELEIVQRADKVPVSGGDGTYVNEVDLGNGHRWREQPNGTWCRFSGKPTNCTVLFAEPGHQTPGTVVAFAARKSSLRDVYFSWAENRASAKVEVALLRSRGTPDYPEGTYVVVVGGADEFVYPGDDSGSWIMVAHSHPGASVQPGYVNPSGKDMQLSMRGTWGKAEGRIQKWIHSQAPDGTWREVEYGLDLDREQYYVQPTGGEPIFFDEITSENLPRDAALRYWELDKAGMERARIDLMIEQNGIEYYLGWYARQFRFDQ
ncbi:MAG: hypothetical protein ABS70_02640 [Nitrospira sp. SCN 59-13]|nr:MAG: hypothetical protein ABS70_02640 [Nitrospira sp. SCN 59-13]